MVASAQTLAATHRLSGLQELRGRILFLLFALLVYRLFSHVPVPGINPLGWAAFLDQTQGTILDMFNMFSGGALQRLSICTLSVVPYITASIIVQMYTAIDPRLKQLRKEGESGRRKIMRFTRYLTLVLAMFQAFAVSFGLETQQAPGGLPIVINPGIGFRVIATISLVTGTMFLVWLGEQITERGIGNGISMIIFAGIVSALPSAVAGTFEMARTGELSILLMLGLLVMVLAVVLFVVFMEMGQRRIPVHYARRQVGRGQAFKQSSHLPLKINMAGVIPPIFASSIILFPATLAGFTQNNPSMRWLQDIQTAMQPGTFVYTSIFVVSIMFFCFFYTALVFDSREMADNLKKTGAFIPGTRPGEHTAHYLDNVLSRLTLSGAIYIILVCLLPELLVLQLSVPFYFGGTSLLIAVVVVIDFMSQVQTHLVSRQYEGLMRKANLSGYGRNKRP
ncbi:MAG: preprotein translocase subunit SecY [Candidatus Porifericomitaceae bacterium WSBS_2022_MAG_OTU9]